jgi:small GTP-binding protein
MTIKKKICLIGAFAVGKTSLVQRHVQSIFSQKYHTTVGVKVDKKQMVVNGVSVDLIIWDLHGEDDFQTVQMSYLRGACGCFYVVDGTRRTTLDVALNLRERVQAAFGGVPEVLALNKWDLQDQWQITAHDMQRLNHEAIITFQTSAKTGQSVEEAFQVLAALALEV